MRNYRPIKASERHKASSEALYRHFLETPVHDSLQEIFAILQEEKEKGIIVKLTFPEIQGNTKNHHFSRHSQLS
jgi:hypothetical protein